MEVKRIGESPSIVNSFNVEQSLNRIKTLDVEQRNENL
jgi:hypothetical protein